MSKLVVVVDSVRSVKSSIMSRIQRRTVCTLRTKLTYNSVNMIVVEKHDLTYYDMDRIKCLHDTLRRLRVVSGYAQGTVHVGQGFPRHYSIRFEYEV